MLKESYSLLTENDHVETYRSSKVKSCWEIFSPPEEELGIYSQSVKVGMDFSINVFIVITAVACELVAQPSLIMLLFSSLRSEPRMFAHSSGVKEWQARWGQQLSVSLEMQIRDAPWQSRGTCSCFNCYSLWSSGHVSRITCLSTSYEERIINPKECKGERETFIL